MIYRLAVCAATLFLGAAYAGTPTGSAAPQALAVAAAIPAAADVAAPVAPKLDPVIATQVFMNRLQGDARAKSDAYAEGGYWLLLWDLLY